MPLSENVSETSCMIQTSLLRNTGTGLSPQRGLPVYLCGFLLRERRCARRLARVCHLRAGDKRATATKRCEGLVWVALWLIFASSRADTLRKDVQILFIWLRSWSSVSQFVCCRFHERVSPMVFSKNFYWIWQYFLQIRREKLTCSGCMLVCDFAATKSTAVPMYRDVRRRCEQKSGPGRTVINFSNTMQYGVHCWHALPLRLYVPIWIYVHVVDLKKAFPWNQSLSWSLQ